MAFGNGAPRGFPSSGGSGAAVDVLINPENAQAYRIWDGTKNYLLIDTLAPDDIITWGDAGYSIDYKVQINSYAIDTNAYAPTLKIDNAGKLEIFGAFHVFNPTPHFERNDTHGSGVLEVELENDVTGCQPARLTLFSNASTPFANWEVGMISFKGMSAAPQNQKEYAQISAYIHDPLSAASDGRLILKRMIAGTLYNVIMVDADSIDVGENLTDPPLHFLGTGDFHVFYDAASGDTPTFKISGYRAGDAKRTLSIKISNAVNDQVDFSGLGRYYFTGDVTVYGSLRIRDNWAIGCESKTAIVSMQSTGDAEFFYLSASGETPSLKITGFRAGDAQRTATIGISSTVNNRLEIKGVSSYNFDGDVVLDSAKSLDCATNGAYLKPRRVSQSATPTPASGEAMIHYDTDDTKVYLVYQDPTGGTKTVELT